MMSTRSNLDTIYYDASCGVCSAGVRRTRRMLAKRGFVFEPLQSPGALELLGLRDGEIPDEMKLRTCGGLILGGADALVYIARRSWWAWPLWLPCKVPGVMPIVRWAYAKFARNRRRISGACRM